MSNKTSSPASAAKIGVVIGAILGLLGTMAGFFFGVIRPALASGRWHELPTQSIWLGTVIMLVIIAICVFHLIRWYRGARAPAAQSEENW